MEKQPIFRKSEWAGRLITEANLGGFLPDALPAKGKLKPDFSCTEDGFGIVVAWKKSVDRALRLNRSKVSMTDVNTAGYAVNKACKCAENILNSPDYSSIREIFAIGMSGDGEENRIIPVLCRREAKDETDGGGETVKMKILENVKSLQEFSPQNIREYRLKLYRMGFGNDEAELRSLAERFGREIQRCTAFTKNEALIAGSGMILAQMGLDAKKGGEAGLALRGEEGDGEKLFKWMKRGLNLSAKEQFVYRFFEILKSPILHRASPMLADQTPAERLMKFLSQEVFPLKGRKEGAIPLFFSAFKRFLEARSYVASVPDSITSVFYDILGIKPKDKVLDAFAGSGDLMASIAKRMEKEGEGQLGQVWGTESTVNLQMAAPAAATFSINGLENCHILQKGLKDNLGIKANAGLLYPPYEVIRESAFDNLEAVKSLLMQIRPGGKALAVVPQSALFAKNAADAAVKEDILAHNTLEGVITLKRRIGIFPCIAVFTAGRPHPADKESKFISYSIAEPYYGAGASSSRASEEVISLWRGEKDDPKSFIKAKAKPEDEWLHSFFYFNSEIPAKEEFEKTIGDYLSFEFSMTMQGRGYLFE